MKTNIGIDIPPTYHSNKNSQMLQDERDVGNEETYFKIKNLLSWQNILSNRQTAPYIEGK